jgi:hypothetical protein
VFTLLCRLPASGLGYLLCTVHARYKPHTVTDMAAGPAVCPSAVGFPCFFLSAHKPWNPPQKVSMRLVCLVCVHIHIHQDSNDGPSPRSPSDLRYCAQCAVHTCIRNTYSTYCTHVLYIQVPRPSAPEARDEQHQPCTLATTSSSPSSDARQTSAVPLPHSMLLQGYNKG